ncbi:neprilysin-2-like [Dermacentor silvarum]|uniref:neprilysin-2-like n=1 Tax=Dermacentor silvarum TaxID=543639 RepID=UPI0018987A9E|nr:neprilysin-2-like [Dermacentor silvarum]
MFHPVTIGLLSIVICVTLGEERTKPNDEVCNDEDCSKLVSQIEAQMGNSTPCEDFYDYVCGNWNGSRELKSKDLKVRAVADLIRLLDAASKPTEEQVNATGILINAYKSCTATGEQEKLAEAVKSVLGKYGLGGWPLLNENHAQEDKDYKEILKETGPRPLFNYFVSDDASAPIITMTKPKEFFVSAGYESNYATLLSSRNDASATDAYNYDDYEDYEKKSEAAYESFIMEAIKLLNKTFPQEKLNETANSIITFEKELYQYASHASDKTTQKNLSEFSDTLGGNISMDKILKKDFDVINYTINGSTIVKVHYEDYYKNVSKYLEESRNTTAMRNYIGWVMVRGMAEAAGTRLHAYYLEYKNKTYISGLREEKRDNKTICVHQLLQHNVMYTASAYFYSKNKFDNESKAEVMKIWKYVNTTFQYIIKNNSWMSNETKTAVLKRLVEMNVVMGYPDWLLDEATINNLYQFVPSIDNGSSFVEHYFYLRENDHYQKLLKLTSKYFNKSYEEVVLKSHAFYDEDTDTAAYPAASLVTHFRKPPIPRSVNFGTIGTIFGQLLSAAMDRYDRKRINGSVVKTEFWDDQTTTSFCNNSKCLNNSEQCRDKEHCYSASHQKLHDYVGVRVSHKALERSKKYYTEPFLLNDTKLDTEDKIFFIFFGSLYCPYSVNEKRSSDVKNTVNLVQERADAEEISFPKSLNEIVSIYHKFNETFSCNGTVSDACHLVPEEKISEVGC